MRAPINQAHVCRAKLINANPRLSVTTVETPEQQISEASSSLQKQTFHLHPGGMGAGLLEKRSPDSAVDPSRSEPASSVLTSVAHLVIQTGNSGASQRSTVTQQLRIQQERK